MTSFGDVRSAAHARDRKALRQALADYDDVAVPTHEVVAYIKKLDAELWPVTWRGGDSASDEVLHAQRREHPTLSAYMIVGSHEIEVLSLNDANASVQRAMLPIRREALDNHWTPWAQANDSDEVREATRLLYACLDDPTLRDPAWAAAWAATRAAPWAAPWAATRAATRAAPWAAAWVEARAAASDAARAAAWIDINHRVAVALIKEVLG